MTLELIAILVLGLMCGSELNVAAFGHPAMGHQPLDVHVPMRASFAATFGHVMPFWMSASTLLNLILLLPFLHLSHSARQLTAVAFAIQVFAVVFSLIFPVPINNRIMKWTPSSLPADWKTQERHWDAYHWFRTCVLIVAFALLVFAMGTN